MNKISFGTGGWRAIIGEDFICDNVRRVAKGISLLMKEEKKTDKPVIIGYDRRFLSENAAKWVAEVLANDGVNVWFMERSVPTPLVMHTVKDKELDFGIEITASHNPSNYNGIKLIVEEGRDAPLEITNHLEELISTVDDVEFTDFKVAVENGLVTYIKNPFNKFLDDIIGLLDMNALRERGLRVLFDSMHGSGTYPLLVIFHTARCTIDTININKDAYFGGVMPAPSERSLFTLRNQVVNGGYDFGIAMDGDGDRLGIIDANGKYINANEILCLLYYYLVKYKGWRGPVVRNLATTHMLDKIAESFGEKCYEVPVGFKHISAKMNEMDAVIGGESSGGLTVRGHIKGKDGVYAAALLVEMIAVTGKKLSDIYRDIEAECGSIFMEERDYKFNQEKKDAIFDVLMNQKQLPELPAEIEHVSYLDGCKVYFKNGGWVIARFSGTEPLLRIFCEMPTLEEAQEVCNVYENFLGL
mgnify:CR=1 FL=1